MRIALDAMGTDDAPAIEVAGACSVLSGVFKHVISEFGCGSVVGLI